MPMPDWLLCSAEILANALFYIKPTTRVRQRVHHHGEPLLVSPGGLKGRLTDKVKLPSVTFDDMEQVEVGPGKERNEGPPQQDGIRARERARVIEIKRVEDLKYMGSESSATEWGKAGQVEESV